MPEEKKHIKVKGAVDKSAIVQGIQSSEENVTLRKLHFMELNLVIQDSTLDALHDLKRVTDVRMDRVISFLLDAGAVLYRSIEEQMIETLKNEEI